MQKMVFSKAFSKYHEDELLQEVLQRFASHMPKYIRKLDKAYRFDREELTRLAHQFRGAFGSYGFEEAMLLCEELEYSDGKSEPDILHILAQLKKICARIFRAYQSLSALCGHQHPRP